MTKIEAGKTYQTRDGRTAIIDAVDCKLDRGDTILGRIPRDDERQRIVTWSSNGKYVGSSDHPDDLIIPPERKSYWVNLYHNENYGHVRREEADRIAAGNRIHRTHVLEIKTEDGEPVEAKLHKVAK